MSTKTAGLYPQYFFYVIARKKVWKILVCNCVLHVKAGMPTVFAQQMREQQIAEDKVMASFNVVSLFISVTIYVIRFYLPRVSGCQYWTAATLATIGFWQPLNTITWCQE